MTTTRTQDNLRAAIAKVDALLNPKNVVIVGATDKPGNWPQRVWRNLKRYGYEGSVFPLNPTRDSVWDVRCYRSFADLPEKPIISSCWRRLKPSAPPCAMRRRPARASRPS